VNIGSLKLPPVITPNIITSIAAPESGFTIEYVAKRKGSVQFDSICHPSQAAILKEFQRENRLFSQGFIKLERFDLPAWFLIHLLLSVNLPSLIASFSM
jgi:hypothetical protein